MVGPGVFQLPTKLTPPRNSRSQESHLVAIARRLFAVVRFTCQLVAKAPSPELYCVTTFHVHHVCSGTCSFMGPVPVSH